jgi:type III secretion protein V
MSSIADARAKGENAITSLMVFLSTRVEMVLAALVVCIVFLLVLPMPTWIMDVLIAFNLFVGGLLIVLAVSVNGMTSFSTFPVILLLSTLFRLGIEVATSRLILLQGDAGEIVDTFGNFVVGGNLVVGLVIFLIVMIVNFIVITKGAERIAEVSARFCLDAMPAKQLAIESELRSGTIDSNTAKRLRAGLDVETQMLGAMDGAMKFVKGDAIAGLIIVSVNLLGGLAIGVMVRNMTIGQAIHQYAILSIGEGLVAQIPALLTSMTAAILVSRINESESDGARKLFGKVLTEQMFNHARAMWTVSMVMCGFAMIPGMPTGTFLTLASIAGGAGYWIGRPVKKEEKKQEETTGKPGEPVVVHEFNQMDALQFVLPATAAAMSDTEQLVNRVHEARNKLVIELGMTLPGINIKYETTMPGDMVELRVYEVPVFRTPIRSGLIAFAGKHAERVAHYGNAVIDTGSGIAGDNVVWLPAGTVATDPGLEGLGVTWPAHMEERILQKLLRYGPRFTGVQAAQKYINWMEGWMAELAAEVKKAVPLPKLAEIIQRLLKERVSIRNMRLIMETLADHGTRERDPAALAEFVRFALRDQICHKLASNGQLPVFVLAPELEEHISTNVRQTANGGFLSLAPHEISQISSAIRAVIAQRHEPGVSPVLVCAQDVRRHVRTLIEPDLPELVVLSVTELTPEVTVNVVTSIEMPGADQFDNDDDFE